MILFEPLAAEQSLCRYQVYGECENYGVMKGHANAVLEAQRWVHWVRLGYGQLTWSDHSRCLIIVLIDSSSDPCLGCQTFAMHPLMPARLQGSLEARWDPAVYLLCRQERLRLGLPNPGENSDLGGDGARVSALLAPARLG